MSSDLSNPGVATVSTLAPEPPEVHSRHPPVVPIAQNPEIPKRRLARLVARFPRGQFVRYLCVGVWNTVFGYLDYALFVFLFSHLLPQHLLYLAVVIASVVSTPINITMAYFGYKFVVFRTKGNYLMEWLRCFAVYGIGMLPGLLILSALTRVLQTFFHNHRAPLVATLHHMQAAVAGHSFLVFFLGHASNSKAAAGYIAGAVVMSFSTISGFVGHRKFSFKPRPAAASAPAPGVAGPVA